MPAITRCYIKASLTFLLLSLSLAVWLGLGANGVAVPAGISAVFLHFLLVGWVTQMIFGVAYWMLPKYSRERPHRSERLAWVVFWLLNVGLVLRGMSEPLLGALQGPLVSGTLVAAALLQWLACLLFVINSWPRVKAR